MTVFNNRADQVQICLADSPLDTTHKPSVDVTMLSVAAVFREYSLGLTLTGMGSDGLEGMTAICDAGGITIEQNEATCAVYGMPRLGRSGCTAKILALDQIPAQVLSALKHRPSQ